MLVLAWLLLPALPSQAVISCHQAYPEFLCNETFSHPSYLKTSSDRVIHIGVSLKIIQKNNNKETVDDFDEGFKGEKDS